MASSSSPGRQQQPPAPVTKILLTGASGYVGQFFLESLITNPPPPCGSGEGREYVVHALHRSNPQLKDAVEKLQQQRKQDPSGNVKIRVAQVDVGDSEEVASFFKEHGNPHFDVCIHTAAVSSPKACNSDPDAARRANVPSALFDALLSSQPPAQTTKIIAMSTDQVYDGTKPPYADEDEDETNPVNVYGETKLEMERYLVEKANAGSAKSKSNAKIRLLRSTLVFGPKPPLADEGVNPKRDTFLHFIASRLDAEASSDASEGGPLDFYTDERRNPVSVRDVVDVLRHFAFEEDDEGGGGGGGGGGDVEIYNLCGPETLNRHEMAVRVFRHLGAGDVTASRHLRAAKKADLNPPPAIRTPSNLEISCDKLARRMADPSDLAAAKFKTFDEILIDTFGPPWSNKAIK